MRVVIYVVLLAGLFAGAVAYAGNRLGAWDPIPPPPVPVGAAGPKRAEKEKPVAPKTKARPASKPAAASPAKKRWLGKLNRLCRKAAVEAAEFGTAATMEEAEALLADVVAYNKRWNARFAALSPPREERRRYARLLGLLEKDERMLAGMLAALREPDLEEYYALNERLESLGARESDLLADIGAADCTYAPVASY